VAQIERAATLQIQRDTGPHISSQRFTFLLIVGSRRIRVSRKSPQNCPAWQARFAPAGMRA
jgi:hypothetical protein